MFHHITGDNKNVQNVSGYECDYKELENDFDNLKNMLQKNELYNPCMVI